jgi:hypothetical protein
MQPPQVAAEVAKTFAEKPDTARQEVTEKPAQASPKASKPESTSES